MGGHPVGAALTVCLAWVARRRQPACEDRARVRASCGAPSLKPDERSVLRDLVRELTEASL